MLCVNIITTFKKISRKLPILKGWTLHCLDDKIFLLDNCYSDNESKI